MLLENYLQESFQQTAYSTNVYIEPGDKAVRFSRLTRADIETFKPRVKLSFVLTIRKGTKRKRSKETGPDEEDTLASDEIDLFLDEEDEQEELSPRRNSGRRSAPRSQVLSDSEDESWQKTMRNGHRTEDARTPPKTRAGKRKVANKTPVQTEVIELLDSDSM